MHLHNIPNKGIIFRCSNFAFFAAWGRTFFGTILLPLGDVPLGDVHFFAAWGRMPLGDVHFLASFY